MKRHIVDDKPCVVGYHTQEFRPNAQQLEVPIVCKASNAWLGKGYYFWTELIFAMYWGEDFKKGRTGTGAYDIYKASINVERCLNTVFNEEQYFFFSNCIEKAIQKFEQDGTEITLKRVHEFLSDNFWNKMGITGIIYDDLPSNPQRNPDRKYSVVQHDSGSGLFFYYKKRIQIVTFVLDNVLNFELYKEEIT